LSDPIPLNRRDVAMSILKRLLTHLPGLTADVFYLALADAGFSPDERAKLVGGVFRSAETLGYMEKTFFSQPSRRNHGNIQQLWRSKICLAMDSAELEKWQLRGVKIDINKIKMYDSLKGFSDHILPKVEKV
jgi:hypothetical protein